MNRKEYSTREVEEMLRELARQNGGLMDDAMSKRLLALLHAEADRVFPPPALPRGAAVGGGAGGLCCGCRTAAAGGRCTDGARGSGEFCIGVPIYRGNEAGRAGKSGER